MPWDAAAVTYCKLQGQQIEKNAILAEPKTADQHDYLMYAMASQYNGDVWVGVSDGLFEGHWLWASDGAAANPFISSGRWAPGQPDNWTDNGNIDVAEDCGGLAAWAGFRFIDWQCNYKVGWYKRALCQYFP